MRIHRVLPQSFVKKIMPALHIHPKVNEFWMDFDVLKKLDISAKP
jgi:hypothetical protein